MLRYLAGHYGDVASVVSLVISVVGFLVTIRAVRQARRAAEEARQAAREAVMRVRSRLLTDDLAELVAIVREADSACRRHDWERSIERCDEARIRLAKLRENRRLAREDRESTDAFVSLLGTLMGHIQTLRASDPAKSLSARRAGQFHDVITVLSQIQGRLQSESWEV